MSGSEEWTRVPSKSHRDRNQANGRSDHKETHTKERQYSVQRRDTLQRERQPDAEVVPRDSKAADGRPRGVGGGGREEPLVGTERGSAPACNPRGILRVPHHLVQPSRPPLPPPPPSSSHKRDDNDWPAATKDSSGAGDTETKQLLWSSIVKTVAVKDLRAQSTAQLVAPSTDSPGSGAETGPGEGVAAVEKKKKRKKKKKNSDGSQGTQSATVRRFTQPLVIELGSVLQEATEGRHAKMTVVAGAPAQALSKKAVPDKIRDEKVSPSLFLPCLLPSISS